MISNQEIRNKCTIIKEFHSHIYEFGKCKINKETNTQTEKKLRFHNHIYVWHLHSYDNIGSESSFITQLLQWEEKTLLGVFTSFWWVQILCGGWMWMLSYKWVICTRKLLFRWVHWHFYLLHIRRMTCIEISQWNNNILVQ